MSDRVLYKVIFHNQGKVYEIYADEVTQGALFGFVEVAGIRFGEKSQLVVDPAEEGLRREFEGVSRLHVPMHAVIRIDQVSKPGIPRVSEGKEGPGASVTPFPAPMPPSKDP